MILHHFVEVLQNVLQNAPDKTMHGNKQAGVRGASFQPIAKYASTGQRSIWG
jgi:hypothetical protein